MEIIEFAFLGTGFGIGAFFMRTSVVPAVIAVIFLGLGGWTCRERVSLTKDGLLIVGMVRRHWLRWSDIDHVDVVKTPRGGCYLRFWHAGRHVDTFVFWNLIFNAWT